jgi:FkbM family methyltransferase
MARCIKPGQFAMDIGANAGYHTLLLSRLAGAKGRVFAFEPVPDTAYWLRKTISLNGISNVTVVEAAVGARNERRQILYSEALDGFATLNGIGHGYYDGQGCLSTQVDVVTADSWLIEHQVEQLSLVKIDVEGAELAVLNGMQSTLRQLRPAVICEFWGTNNIQEGQQFLGDHRYQLTTLDQWSGRVRGRDVVIENVLALPTDPGR